MATTQKWIRGSADTILTTELNSLANNTNVVGSTVQLTSEGYVLAEAELVITFVSNPVSNTAISIWFLREIDGVNFEDGSASITPLRNPDIVFPIRSVTSSQRIIKQCVLPPGNFQTLVRNDGTGVALSSSGHSLKLRPLALQSV